MTTTGQHDQPNSHNRDEDRASAPTDAAESSDDPWRTEHPAGQAQAAENAENEPAG